jgi:hypothetical protein
MRSVLLAGAALLSAASVAAADPAAITGTWKPVGEPSSARVGTSPGYFPKMDKPVVNQPGTGWTITIDQQDGRSFAGSSTGPNGKSQALVGVFRQDGKRFVIASEVGSGDGEMTGDGMELCWVDNVDNYAAATCGMYQRAK